jgi:hypothetical protein
MSSFWRGINGSNWRKGDFGPRSRAGGSAGTLRYALCSAAKPEACKWARLVASERGAKSYTGLSTASARAAASRSAGLGGEIEELTMLRRSIISIQSGWEAVAMFGTDC